MKIIFTLLCFFMTLQMNIAQTTDNKNIDIIKSLRAASNEAIAKHDVVALSKYWLDDVVVIRGNSTHLTGKDSILQTWKKLFADNPEIIYVRTPSEIIISSNDTLAWETGTWTAFHSYSSGGNYSAMWKKLGDTWKIQAELFVSLF